MSVIGPHRPEPIGLIFLVKTIEKLSIGSGHFLFLPYC